MKKVFKQIFISKVDREDTVRSPLPTAPLQRDNFLTKMWPFVSDVRPDLSDRILSGHAVHLTRVHVIREPDSVVTRIKILQETLDENIIKYIIDALESG